MDVRCENCGTEYELDDSMLRPGGVTVRCTTCSHKFRIGRPSVTVVGPPADRDPPRVADGAPRPGAPEGAPREPLAFSPSGPRAGGKERNWLIRLPTGEIETCRELATLQQWIISGRVTRQSGISRTGSTWKRLGDIKELVSFFEIAEEARRAARMQSSGVPRTMDQRAKSEVLRTLQGVPVVSASTGRSGPVSIGVEPEAGSGPMVRPGSVVGAPVRGESSRPVTPMSPAPMESSGPVKTTRSGSAGGPAGESAGEWNEVPAGGSGGASADESADGWGEEAVERSTEGSGTASAGVLAGAQAARRSAPALPGAQTLRGPGGAMIPPAPPRAASPNAMPKAIPDAGPNAGPDAAADAGPRSGSHGDDTTPPQGVASARPAAAGPRARSTGQWRGQVRAAGKADDDGPQGPVRGLARRASSQEPVFGGKIRPIKDEADHPPGHAAGPRGAGSRASGPLADDDGDAPESAHGGAGRWVVLFSLVLMAGAAAVVYWFVFRERGLSYLDTPADVPPDMIADGGLPGSGDGGALGAVAPDAAHEALVAKAGERLVADTRAGLEAILPELEQAAAEDEAATSLRLLVARARVRTALAQHGFDAAAAMAADGDEDEARGLRRSADQQVLAALALAQNALKLDRQDPGALVVMADILRLQGKPMSQLRGYLDQALARDAQDADARLVRALALAGTSGKGVDEARAALTALAGAAGGDVRPRYRLALLDFETGRYDEAKQRAGEVVAAQPGHEGARALLERIRTAMAVDTSDPMPPEEDQAAPSPEEGTGEDRPDRATPDRATPDRATEGGNGASGGASGSDAPDSADDSYASLLTRASRKRQAGQCDEAAALFERALDINPIGVEALTGMGYCHIEQRQFASAQGKLRAALGVSPRNQDALWGMAEAYAKQGLPAKAVEWYQRYLDEHPNGNRADTARRQIERLGSGAGPGPGPGDGDGDDSGDAVDEDQAPPAPAPPVITPEETPAPAAPADDGERNSAGGEPGDVDMPGGHSGGSAP